MRFDQTAAPVLPVAVAPEPAFSRLLADLKVQLDGIVAEQQKKFDRHAARLAQLSPEQKAPAYTGQTGKGLFAAAQDMFDAIKALPGLYVALLKKELKLLSACLRA